MLLGVPKEIKNHEYRVGLAPGSLREVVAHGHQVLVESGAGEGIAEEARERKPSVIQSECPARTRV